MSQDDANIIRLTEQIEEVAIDLSRWNGLLELNELLATDSGLQQYGGYDLVVHLLGKMIDQAYQEFDQTLNDLVKNAHKK